VKQADLAIHLATLRFQHSYIRIPGLFPDSGFLQWLSRRGNIQINIPGLSEVFTQYWQNVGGEISSNSQELVTLNNASGYRINGPELYWTVKLTDYRTNGQTDW